MLSIALVLLYLYRVVHDPVSSNGSLNSGDEEKEDDGDLFVNPNRPLPLDVKSSSGESSSEVED